MPDPFNGYRYLRHLRARWRLPVIAVFTSGLIALGVSLLLPVRYTATATVVIEPPAGGDFRVATAVTPIYLESLKSYEHFASSDQLFARAAKTFHLRRGGREAPIETLKRRVLHVSIPRNTKVMEISATDEDPKAAHGLALYIAQATIDLNRETSHAADADLSVAATRQLEATGARVRLAEAAWRDAAQRLPLPDALRMEIDRLNTLAKDLSRAQLALEPGYGQPAGDEAAMAKRLGREAQELARQATDKQRLLARRMGEVEAAESQLRDARAAYDQAQKAAGDVSAMVGLRGERLTILDPGIVPERPSSPNVPLNVLAALFLGGMLSLLYLTVEYGVHEQRASSIRAARWEAARL